MSQKSELSLIAVNLVNDGFNGIKHIAHSIRHIDSTTAKRVDPNGDVLGFVALSSLSVKLSEFRHLMKQQISLLPNGFTFLSKEGWPVSTIQELNLNLYYIVNVDQSMVLIKRQFDKHRFGVHSVNGVSLGFIFAEMDNTAQEIRHLIGQEFNLNEDKSYQFIDRNGWPVTHRQEQMVRGWDLMIEGVLRISSMKRSSDIEVHDSNDMDVIEGNPIVANIRKKKRASEASTVEMLKVSEDTSHAIMPLISLNSMVEQSSAITSAASVYHPSVVNVKPILISYVRAEAEQHARQLKSELQDLGCNVFLDVDEIEGGHDWADALNNAVLNCDLFVPLITPNYGYTQWTNREVKLADIKGKQIIPISFLDSWPPECLAIQFASTQYIPWKTTVDIEKCMSKGEKESLRARDIRFWDQPYVRTTAINIAEHLRLANLEKERLTTQIIPTPNTSIDMQTTPQIIASDRPMRPILFLNRSSEGINLKKRTNKIVISAHPTQKEFASFIRQELSKYGFDVWSSTDMCLNAYTSSIDTLITPTSETNECRISTPQMTLTSSQRIEEFDQMSDQTLYIGSQFSESSQESQILTPNDNQSNRCLKRNFSINMTDPIAYTQCSQDLFSSQTCIFSPEDLDKARNFRDRVHEASLVIIVLSKNFCKSRICKQQAFYCDIRKRVIPIKYDDFRTPHWLSKLFDDDKIVEHNPNDMEGFITQLSQMASKLVTSSKDTFRCAMSDARIDSLAAYVSRQLPSFHDRKKVMVYVAGSTKFFSPLSEPICRAIGQALASIPFIVLVTGGVYGVGETTGRNFCEERELLLKEKPANLFHVLPRYVSEDLSMKARQNPDGTFQALPFGHTLFIGDSFRERDSVVARMFNYCIIIEGGPRTARIAEEFLWNDNIVIPIVCTGGSANGDFDVSPKIHDVPIGVHQDDWATLGRRDVTAENIAESVKNIICSLVKCRSRKKFKHMSGLKVTKIKTIKIRPKT